MIVRYATDILRRWRSRNRILVFLITGRRKQVFISGNGVDA